MRFIPRKTALSILFTTALLSLAFTLSDDAFISQLVEKFKAYHQQRPLEKTYLHTDRDTYLTGETIWLKGYLFSGNTHNADTISRVLHVDLVDVAAKRVRLRIQLKATNSYAPGQLALPDTLPAGTYQLRAYTNYMRNEPDAYFFTKTLAILKPDGQLTPTARAASSKPDVQFLPEGGQLVEGIDGRVAFKAVDQTGRSVPIEGFVLGAQNDTVVGFSAMHQGMGYFSVKPENGQTYKVFARVPGGAFAPYPLPAIQPLGVTMQVDNLSNKDNIRVYVRHNKTSNDPAAMFTLLAQTRGQVVQAAKVSLAKKTAVVLLPRADFPEGITQLTLFDETNKPVCERLAFIDKKDQIAIALTTSKTTYASRERVDLTLTTTDADGKPVPANLSLAAVDARLAPQLDTNAATITSHLLLSSDLVGTIEQPGYYFNPANTDRFAKLDLLLMTQGWRRFAWTDVLAETPAVTKYPVERGLTLSGRVLRPSQKGVNGKVNLTFIVAQRDSAGNYSNRDFLMGETDEQGNYAAYDLNFTDSTTVLVQATKGKGNRDLSITLDQLLMPTVTIVQPPYNPLEFGRDELAEFIKRTNEYMEIERQIRRNREVLLESVTVRAKKYQAPDTRKIYSNADATVKFDQNNTAGRMNILEVIQGRVAGVQVTGSGMNVSVNIRGAANFGGAVGPLFVLDGTPMDLQGILSIPPTDVDQVDVLKGPSAAIYGSQAAGGVISILTKRGSPNYDLTKEAAPGVLVAKLAGYAPVREFYAPRYDAKKPEHIRPDYRATLFWSPMIQTDEQGKATVSFYTSDNKTDIRLQAEGATFSGMPGMGRRTLAVK
ncbi:TonB-dependent receptor plug domain-containing protein [Spirosoma montaniterrae]|uniref:TonB-dependent receptor n=1 Tax=Spirosoma montaniterrae TaxID=1178516 RepID=A0A1P9WRI0_9BACT|nr:TonB-dependent receptor plug domain-containing protein [Spirosoma montaniterrae]AQG77972.1 TonB-dependent receptor [Spirosoma montaniterrae]